jgi:hypothetical protein
MSKGHLMLLDQPCLRLLSDPLQSIFLLFKSEKRIDFTATPKNAYGIPLPDPVLPDYGIDIGA